MKTEDITFNKSFNNNNKIVINKYKLVALDNNMDSNNFDKQEMLGELIKHKNHLAEIE